MLYAECPEWGEIASGRNLLCWLSSGINSSPCDFSLYLIIPVSDSSVEVVIFLRSLRDISFHRIS
jgi:hypothetical protein